MSAPLKKIEIDLGLVHYPSKMYQIKAMQLNYCMHYVSGLKNEFNKSNYHLFWVHIIPGVFLDTSSHYFI